jgi:hypothetical protein
VTSFNGASSKYVYEKLYCDRGKAELWIKESKLSLSSDRSCCTKATANQFRLLLSVAAYQLLHGLREEELSKTSLVRATFGRIRLCLLKVAARVEAGKTFIRLHLPQQFGFREVFFCPLKRRQYASNYWRGLAGRGRPPGSMGERGRCA